MKKTLLTLALLFSIITVGAQESQKDSQKFKPRYSVGGAAYFAANLGSAKYDLPGVEGPSFASRSGFSGYGSFEVQLSQHSGIELNMGGAVEDLGNALVTSLSYKYYGGVLNFNAGLSHYSIKNGDNCLGVFLRMSKDFTIHKNLYCEPFVDFSVLSYVNNDLDFAYTIPSVGVALKYRF